MSTVQQLSAKFINFMTIFLGIYLSLAFFGAATTSAQEDVATEVEAFSFTAPKDSSLTLLARSAILTQAQAQNIEIDNSRLIAAETCLTQSLGSYMLDIDQSVTISATDVTKALDETNDLSEAQLTAWSAYGPVDVQTIVKPDMAPSFVPTELLSDAGQEASQTANTDSNVEVVREDSDDSELSDAPWYWWFVGGGAVAAMWYILGGDEVIARRRK